MAQNESSPSPTASDEDRVATASDPIPITVYEEKYHKAEDLAGKRKGRKKTSFGNMALRLFM
jgi:hypothetical protein